MPPAVPPPAPSPPPFSPSAPPFDRWKPRRSRPGLALCGSAVALSVYVAVVVNFVAPVGVRFASERVNTCVVFFALLLPSIAFVLILWQCQGAIRTAGAILVALPALPSLVPAFFLLAAGDPVSYERLHDIRAGRFHIVVYRTNGGATTSYGICVRQELPLGHGLSLVRAIYGATRAEDATVEVLTPNVVRIVSDNSGNPEPKTVQLQPLLGF